MTTAVSLIDDLAGDFVARHPGEAARTLQSLDASDAAGLLGAVPVPRAAIALAAMGADGATLVTRRAPRDTQWQWLAAMDPSDAAAVIQRLGDSLDRTALLASLPVATRRDLETFLSYPDSTAGSLMDAATPIFRADARAGDVEVAIRESGRTDDEAVLVVDADRRLIGAIDTIRVLLADPAARLQQLALRRTPSIDAFAHRDEVAEMLESHALSVLPVIDIDGRPVGAIRQAELATVAEEEASADMQSMVGASREERALSPVSFAVRKRLPWLQINLGTAFLAASVVGLFEATIAQFTALAVLLPVVAGQSGNTGAQSLAVTMRGLALHEISLRQWARVVSKESLVGLLNGVAVAVVTMAGVYLWSGSLGLCGVIGLAMVISMAIAGVAGAAVPLVLSALGQDPAQSSSIVLTTVTDIMGFFSFLGLATLFASLL